MKRFNAHKLVALLGGFLLATTVQATPQLWVQQLWPYFAPQGAVTGVPGQGDMYQKKYEYQYQNKFRWHSPVTVPPGQGDMNQNQNMFQNRNGQGDSTAPGVGVNNPGK